MSQTKVQLVGNVVGDVVFSGIVTATSFSGDGSGLTGVGVGTEDSINTTGIITASTVTANEFVGSGDRLIFSPVPTSFSPIDGETGVSALSSPNISITYNRGIILGVGTITLRKNSSSGDIAESYQVGVSTRATVSGQTLTIDPTNNFDYNQEYYVAIPQGGVTNYDSNTPGLALTTYNFTTESGPVLSSALPSFGSTSVGLSTNVVLTFNKNIRAGVGTITLRTVSAGGTVVESYDVSSSGRLTFNTNTLTIDPTASLSLNTNYYVVVPNNAVAGYAGTNTYNFTTISIPTTVGSAFGGGYAICLSGGLVWVAAPNTSEVSRTWYSRADANTRAQSVSGCTGWFVPSIGQLQNPGYVCRTYWDSYSSNYYWSDSTFPGPAGACLALNLNFATGVVPNYAGTTQQTLTYCVRSFRCVTY